MSLGGRVCVRNLMTDMEDLGTPCPTSSRRCGFNDRGARMNNSRRQDERRGTRRDEERDEEEEEEERE